MPITTIIASIIVAAIITPLILIYDSYKKGIKKQPHKSLLGAQLKEGDFIRNKNPYPEEKRYRFVGFNPRANEYLFQWETTYLKGDFEDMYLHAFTDEQLEHYEKVDDSKKKSF